MGAAQDGRRGDAGLWAAAVVQFSTTHVLKTQAPGPLLSSGVGAPLLGSPCGCLKLSGCTTPSSHAPTPAPSAPPRPSLQSAYSAGHLRMELFWQEALVVLPDQLAPLLGSVAISGGAEAEARVGAEVCSGDRPPAPHRASDSLPLQP